MIMAINMHGHHLPAGAGFRNHRYEKTHSHKGQIIELNIGHVQ